MLWASDPCDGQASTIQGIRLTADGTILAGSHEVLDNIGDLSAPAVSSNGVVYLATWDAWRSVWASLASTGGFGPPIGLSYDPVTQDRPALASNGSDFFVVWSLYRDGVSIHGTRVSGTGQVLDLDSVRVSTAPGEFFAPSVASDGAQFLAVWSRAFEDVGTGYEIGGALIAADGSITSAADIPIYTGPSLTNMPAIASNGAGYFVVWRRFVGIFGARVSSAGEVLETDVAVSPAGYSGPPAVASDGAGYLAAWSGRVEPDAGELVIQGTRIDSDGQVLDQVPLSLSVRGELEQGEPSLAWNGATYLIAWEQDNGTDHDIVATRLSSAGEILDPDGILVAGGPPPPDSGGCSAIRPPASGLPLLVLWLGIWPRRRAPRRRRPG